MAESTVYPLEVNDENLRWISFANDTTITSTPVAPTDAIQAVTSYTYSYDISSEPYEYGVNNFSMRYGYKKIDWKWYQPIKNWLKFNLKVLFS